MFFCFFFTAGIKFTHRPKISIFGPQRRLVALIRVKFGITKGHVDPLGHTKFHANRFIKVGTWPPNIKKYTFFGKESPRRGEPLDRFLRLMWNFIQPTILH